MSTDEVTFDTPVRKPKKAAAKKTAKKAPNAAKPTEAFPGMTRTVCADSCGAKGCAIGTSYCSHPCKGGLQAGDMSNPALLRKLQVAREQLRVKIDPDRFKD
jgi:hypothetical protein